MLPQKINTHLLEFKAEINALLKENRVPAYAGNETNAASEENIITLTAIVDNLQGFSINSLTSLSAEGGVIVELLNQLDNNQYSWVPNVFNQQSKDVVEKFKNVLCSLLNVNLSDETAASLPSLVLKRTASNDDVQAAGTSLWSGSTRLFKRASSMASIVVQKATNYTMSLAQTLFKNQLAKFKQTIVAMIAVAEYKLALYDSLLSHQAITQTINSLNKKVTAETFAEYVQQNDRVVTEVLAKLSSQPIMITSASALYAPFNLRAEHISFSMRIHQTLLDVQYQLKEKWGSLINVSEHIDRIEKILMPDSGSSSSSFFPSRYAESNKAKDIIEKLANIASDLENSNYANVIANLIDIFDRFAIDTASIKILMGEEERPLHLSA